MRRGVCFSCVPSCVIRDICHTDRLGMDRMAGTVGGIPWFGLLFWGVHLVHTFQAFRSEARSLTKQLSMLACHGPCNGIICAIIGPKTCGTRWSKHSGNHAPFGRLPKQILVCHVFPWPGPPRWQGVNFTFLGRPDAEPRHQSPVIG